MNYWKFPLVCFAGAVFAMASCSHPPSSGTTSGNGGSGGTGSTCSGSNGSLGCPCNGTACDQGLVCATTGNNGQNQCVSTGSGTGGTTGQGGSSGGTTGSGGAVATGGSTGNGGSSSTGGSTGNGGSSATGGSTGNGGSTGTGGSTGSGGSSPGNNLIANGDFSQGANNWGIPNGSPSNAGVNNGEYCLTLSNGSGTVILGWGGTSISANLTANVNYALSFQASSTGALSDFEVHVGSAVSVNGSYPIDYQVSPSNAPGNSLTSYTEMFTISTADPQAGIAFQVAASNGNPTVCVDNVSLIQN